MRLLDVARRYGYRSAAREVVARVAHWEPVLIVEPDEYGRVYRLRCRRCGNRLTTRDHDAALDFAERHFAGCPR